MLKLIQWCIWNCHLEEFLSAYSFTTCNVWKVHEYFWWNGTHECPGFSCAFLLHFVSSSKSNNLNIGNKKKIEKIANNDIIVCTCIIKQNGMKEKGEKAYW